MRSLVTGGAGFIGSHVARRLVDEGDDVVVVDDLSAGFRDQVPDGAEFVRGSVTDAEFVADLFARERFDHVFHLAAYAAEGLSHFVRRFNYTQNVLGSINLINEAVKHDVECFVFASSIAVYGDQPVPMHEDMTPAPIDPYGISKYAVELDLRAAHEMFGLPYVILRPHNVYGEHQNVADPYRNVVGIFVAQALRGEPMTIFGDGKQRRAFTHIDDVAPQVVRAARTPAALSQVINLGCDDPCTVIEIAQAVSRAAGIPLKTTHLPARLEARDAFCRHDKSRRIFGTSPKVPLQRGIERMLSWASGMLDRSTTELPDVEVPRNLPVQWHSTAFASDPR
jgi:UDP-glucose 4-epimerase